ncbi:Hypothetical predicted protein [Drosophila guanche]|uniref:Uncharacterized protein n=1 Tax=Drosophila guanche TaxID=7266 RepID=A0A3B0K399_DROGU|nr:Hypothetical predicted protein [Drosophila guanche]
MTTTIVRLAAEVAAGKQLPAALTIKTNRRYGGQAQAHHHHHHNHHQNQNQNPNRHQSHHHPYGVTANSNTICNRPVRIRSVATSVIVAPISSTSNPTNADGVERGGAGLGESGSEADSEEQVAAANGLLAWSRAAASQQQQQQQHPQVHHQHQQPVLMQG